MLVFSLFSSQGRLLCIISRFENEAANRQNLTFQWPYMLLHVFFYSHCHILIINMKNTFLDWFKQSWVMCYLEIQGLLKDLSQFKDFSRLYAKPRAFQYCTNPDLCTIERRKAKRTGSDILRCCIMCIWQSPVLPLKITHNCTLNNHHTHPMCAIIQSKWGEYLTAVWRRQPIQTSGLQTTLK